MYYRLYKVGDKNGKDKTDKASLNRIGRVFDFTVDYLLSAENSSVYLECVYPSFLKSLVTSHVVAVESNKEIVKLYTENSIYYFVEDNELMEKNNG